MCLHGNQRKRTESPFRVMMHVRECHVSANSPIRSSLRTRDLALRRADGARAQRRKKKEGEEKKKRNCRHETSVVVALCSLQPRNFYVKILENAIRIFLDEPEVESTSPRREFSRCFSFLALGECNFISQGNFIEIFKILFSWTRMRYIKLISSPGKIS